MRATGVRGIAIVGMQIGERRLSRSLRHCPSTWDRGQPARGTLKAPLRASNFSITEKNVLQVPPKRTRGDSVRLKPRKTDSL
jgi:hypothetical protein